MIEFSSTTPGYQHRSSPNLALKVNDFEVSRTQNSFTSPINGCPETGTKPQDVSVQVPPLPHYNQEAEDQHWMETMQQAQM